jgi:general nucleoside transport system permease protein
MDAILQSILSASFVAAILRLTTPILLPSLGALISSQAGVVNIGLEGIMLTAAFTGVVAGAAANQVSWLIPFAPWLGLLAGVLSGVILALILAFFHLELGGDIVLAGLAINILGAAGTVAVMTQVAQDRSSTGKLQSPVMPNLDLPVLQSIPGVGGALYDMIGRQNVVTWIALISVAAVAFFLYRVPKGRHLRAVGENPDAAASVGINVKRTRYLALAISGGLAALGGVHLSMGYLTTFQRGMSAGRGYVALAIPALGGNTPIGTMIASLFYGFADTLSIRLGTLRIPELSATFPNGQVPSEYTQMIPYIVTILALVISAVLRARGARRAGRRMVRSAATG